MLKPVLKDSGTQRAKSMVSNMPHEGSTTGAKHTRSRSQVESNDASRQVKCATRSKSGAGVHFNRSTTPAYVKFDAGMSAAPTALAPLTPMGMEVVDVDT